ncbi:MAG: hypothetical protein QF704_11470, partial [Anaerolineales bacterium]|nr:hypothetical protein [Anaerolineales bacterium]
DNRSDGRSHIFRNNTTSDGNETILATIGDNTTFTGKVGMGNAGITSSFEFPVNIDINSSTTQQCGLEVRQHTSGNDARMRFQNANGKFCRFGMSNNGDFFIEPFNGVSYTKHFKLDNDGNATFAGDVSIAGHHESGDGYLWLWGSQDQTLTTSYQAVGFSDDPKVVDSLYSWSSQEEGIVYINSDGRYKITADVSTYAYNTTTRSQTKAVIYVNGSAIDGTDMYMYNRQTTEGASTGSATIITDLEQDDEVELRVKEISGICKTYGAGCRLTIERI